MAAKRRELIQVQLVPKEVDTQIEKFRDDHFFREYAESQSQIFLQSMSQHGPFEKKDFPDEKAAVYAGKDKDFGLLFGFKPDYRIVLIPKDSKASLDDCWKKNIITAPVFDLFFQPKEYSESQRILQTALSQFYLRSDDGLEDNHCIRFMNKKGKIVKQGLELLLDYFPKGTVIDVRVDYGFGNAKGRCVL